MKLLRTTICLSLSLFLTSCDSSSSGDGKVTLSGNAFVVEAGSNNAKVSLSNQAANVPFKVVDASDIDRGALLKDSRVVATGETGSGGEFSATVDALKNAGIIVDSPVKVSGIVNGRNSNNDIVIDKLSTLSATAVEGGVHRGTSPSLETLNRSRIDRLEDAAEQVLENNPDLDFTDPAAISAAAQQVNSIVEEEMASENVSTESSDENSEETEDISAFENHSFKTAALISNDSGCGLDNSCYLASDNNLFFSSFGDNRDVSFQIISRYLAAADGLRIFGEGDHECSVNLDPNNPNSVSVQCTNPNGGFCSQSFVSDELLGCAVSN